MNYFRSPIHSPSFLSISSVSTPSPKPSEALIDDQLTKTQDLFDDIFNYVSCANDDITEMANQIEKNCSAAEQLVEILNSQKSLLNQAKNNDSPNIFTQEKSSLGKRSNPYLNEFDKEALLNVESSEVESILEDSEDFVSDSENDSIDLSTSVETIPKSYRDLQTQTSPIIFIQMLPVYFLCFPLPANVIQDQKEQKSDELRPQENREIYRQLILVQPAYVLLPENLRSSLPLMAPLGNKLRNEIEELKQ